MNIAHDVSITYVAVDPDGDAIQGELLPYSGPSILELPVEGLIAGFRFSPGAAVSLTIDDPTNGPGVDYSASQVMSPGQTDLWFDLAGKFAFDAGGSVSMSDGTSDITETVGGIAINNIDFDSQTISGSANPGSHIEIRDFTDGLMRHEVANHNGQWQTSFSVGGDFPGEQNTADITPATTGGISQRHARDRETGVEWLAPVLIQAGFSRTVIAVDQPATFTASFQGYVAPIEVIEYSLDAEAWLTLNRTDEPLSYAKGTGSTVLAFAEPGLYTIFLRAQDTVGLWSELPGDTPQPAASILVYDPDLSFYFHGSGPTANPPTLFLDTAAPTGATPRYRDSASVNFSGGNPWKQVGTWTASPTLPAGTLVAPASVGMWLGLKNSDDQGTNFDIRVEIYNDGTLAASGETFCISSLTRNPSFARQVDVPLTYFAPIPFDAVSNVMSARIQIRIGTNGSGAFCGGHRSAVGLRVYFDAATRPTSINATFGS